MNNKINNLKLCIGGVMKKTLLVLMVMFVVCFAGCGSDNDSNNGGDSAPAAVTEGTEEDTTDPEPETDSAEDTVDTKEDTEEDGTGGVMRTTCYVAIESQIDGVFKGWYGDTVVNLINGQIWKQAEYHYYYHYSYGADVVIYLTETGRCKMIVEDLKAVAVELVEKVN